LLIWSVADWACDMGGSLVGWERAAGAFSGSRLGAEVGGFLGVERGNC
jgi:hypothetical protein